jgi:hypothetical protein
MKPDEQPSEAVVERVSLSGRKCPVASTRLEGRAIAEIETRQQSGVVTDERDRGRTDRDQPFREPGSGGVARGASLVSMGKLAASHSGTPPLRTLILMPLRRSSAAT